VNHQSVFSNTSVTLLLNNKDVSCRVDFVSEQMGLYLLLIKAFIAIIFTQELWHFASIHNSHQAIPISSKVRFTLVFLRWLVCWKHRLGLNDLVWSSRSHSITYITTTNLYSNTKIAGELYNGRWTEQVEQQGNKHNLILEKKTMPKHRPLE